MMVMEGLVAGSAARAGVPAPARDLVLIEAAAGGDRAAFDDLIESRLSGLFHTALAILRHDADARDAVQDSCVQAWRRLDRLRERERFDAWLGTILMNECRGLLRSRRRVQIREIDLDAVRGTAGARRASETPLAQRVAEVDSIRRAFVRLDADDRILLALHHADRRSVEEIAELIGAPAGTVKWRLHRARQALIKALERER
jgi:RNA polymerase sigma-70 factor (ECF subfamily)